MAEDKPTVRITTPTDLAGAVPHLVGYQPGDHQLAVFGFRGSQYAGATVHTWMVPLGEGPAHAAAAAEHITTAFGDRADSFLAIGYGPDGPDRALLFRDALEQHSVDTAHAWAVQDDRLRVFSPEHGWSEPLPLETTAGIELDLITGNRPEPSREDLARRYAPVPERQQAIITPQDAERFGAMAPSAQYEWASKVLTDGAQSKTGLTDDQVGIIAHAATASVHVRDNLLHDVIGDPVKADRLVDAFRRTSDGRRPDMADLAAAGQYLTRGSTVGIEAIARHTTGSLGRMVDKAAFLGLDPQPLIDSLDRTELRERLAMADRQHYRGHLTNHSPSLTNPDPRAPTRPASGDQQPRRHPGAWRDMDR